MDCTDFLKSKNTRTLFFNKKLSSIVICFSLCTACERIVTFRRYGRLFLVSRSPFVE